MKPRLHSAALAVASDGTILVNAAHLDGEPAHDPNALLARALADGGAVFIGVSAGPASATVLRLLDDRAAEAACLVAGQRRRCGRRRMSRRTSS